MADPVKQVQTGNSSDTKPQSSPDPMVSNWVAAANRSGWDKMAQDARSAVDRVTDKFRKKP